MSRKPIADTGIEIIHHFPVKRMSRIVVVVQFTVGNASSDFLPHPTGREDVILSANHQTGCLNVSELIQHVVIHTGRCLSLQSVKRLRC